MYICTYPPPCRAVPYRTASVRRIYVQGGTAFADVLSTVLVGGDGSVVLAGYTSGSWTGSSNAGEEDYLVVKLDSDGNEIWVWQVRTYGTAIYRGRHRGRGFLPPLPPILRDPGWAA